MLSVKILWLQRWDTPQPRLSGLPLWFQLLSLLSHFLYWLFLPCSLQPSRSCRRRRFVISSSTLNKEKGIVNKIRPRFLHSSIKNVAIDVLTLIIASRLISDSLQTRFKCNLASYQDNHKKWAITGPYTFNSINFKHDVMTIQKPQWHPTSRTHTVSCPSKSFL